MIATLGLVGALGCQSLRGQTPAESPHPVAPSARNEAPSPAVTPTSKPPQLETVYFDFERSELREDARAALQRDAEALKQSSQWTHLTIQGHCDERGSEEYNMALGERRADAVSRYLKDLGVPAKRLDTVSYGEDRPVARGHDEVAWQKNRRAELVVEPSQQASR